MKTLFIFFGIFFSSLSPGRPSGPSSQPRLIIPRETVIYLSLGETQIPVKTLQYGELKDLLFINLHDNETTSVIAAKRLLESKGGTLVKLENTEQRNLRFRFHNVYYEADPNRIFSREGIKKTLEPQRRVHQAVINEVEKFANRLLMLMPATSSCIIGLHNNGEGEFSIQSFMAGGDREIDAKAAYLDKNQDPDDFAFTTDNHIFQHMVACHYNTVWQDNRNATRDGSLSIYCGEMKRRYINIETEHGKTEQHFEMLSKLLSFLRN